MAVITTSNLTRHAESVKRLDGKFAEIGVFRGDTFKRLALLARQHYKTAHGFDSFQGMDEPTELDFGYCDAGRLSVGGVEKFVSIMDDAGVLRGYYKLFPGFIPECFDNDIADRSEYSLAIVDVDQYKPTKTALPWIWDRIQVGGILIMDDYFKNREGLAAKAIDEWLSSLHPLDYAFVEYTDTQLVIKKMHIADNPLPPQSK